MTCKAILSHHNHTYWPQGYKTYLMLNSIEHEIYPAHKCFVDILTFISRINSREYLSLKQEKTMFFNILVSKDFILKGTQH